MENKKYDSLPFRDIDQKILTNKCDRVRSKTEKILADKFYNLGIEYKYECPISIAGEVKYPDFTFFDFKTGGEIYWEHFGMMDDDDYSKNALKKLNFYQRNNFIVGKNLIVAFESSKSYVDYEVVDILINEYLINNN